jgi:small GTP-binding protein
MKKNYKEKKEVKVILLGESGVGKTCIIERYMSNKFNSNLPSTLCSAYSIKKIIRDNTLYSINICDTTGQEKYHSVTNLFVKGSNIVILVYSIDSVTSFNNLEYWYSMVVDNLKDTEYILAIIGNKTDLFEEEVVSEEEGKRFAESKNAKFQLVSAKEDPDGINKLFDNLFEEIIQNTHINLLKKDDSYLISRSSTDTEKKSSCC